MEVTFIIVFAFTIFWAVVFPEEWFAALKFGLDMGILGHIVSVVVYVFLIGSIKGTIFFLHCKGVG